MSYSDRDGVIWMDGEFVAWRDAKVHVLTHTLHYGVGAFEGIRAYKTAAGTAVFRLDEHIKRLFDTVCILNMEIPFAFEAIVGACLECIKKNELEAAYLRPLVFYGSEGMGLHAQDLSVHVMIATWFWGAYLGAEGMEQGIRVKTSSFARHSVNSVMSKAKACGNYINSILALQEAERDGYDEALLLDTEGMVSEGSGENIFVVRDGVLYTPELPAILEGITRATVMELAVAEGLRVVEKRITRDEVYIAEEAFFTGTAAEVTPIRELDGRPIGGDSPGPITKKLQAIYLDVVEGRRSEYAHWLTVI